MKNLLMKHQHTGQPHFCNIPEWWLYGYSEELDLFKASRRVGSMKSRTEVRIFCQIAIFRVGQVVYVFLVFNEQSVNSKLKIKIVDDRKLVWICFVLFVIWLCLLDNNKLESSRSLPLTQHQKLQRHFINTNGTFVLLNTSECQVSNWICFENVHD